MARSEVTEKLSLGDALKDLGWFSIVFAVVVGGPSLLAILQHVFVDHRLVEGFQWIVDGYNGLMALLGAAIEPLLRPAIDRLNSWLSWRLELRPVWRPLFALAMVCVMGIARVVWREDRHGTAALIVTGGGLGGLLGALAAGLSTFDGGWLQQCISVAFLIFAVAFFLGICDAVYELATNSFSIEGLLTLCKVALVLGLSSFLTIACLALVLGVENGAGLLALGIQIALLGAYLVWYGLSEDELGYARIGFTIVGGFLAAGVILLADFAVRAVSGI